MHSKKNKVSNVIGSIPGFRSGGVACGIKKDGAKDLALIVSDPPSVAAGVFTKNRVHSPSVDFSKRNLQKSGTVGAVVVNSGNANACVGSQGLEHCKAVARRLGQTINLHTEQILMASTGMIGVPLPIQTFLNGIPYLEKSLSFKGWKAAAEGIMTTDLTSKSAKTQTNFGGKNVVIAGIAKGSGMIHPNMATMLGFIVTNAAIERNLLQKALKRASDLSFNAITVDGECSTNDCVFLLANGLAGNEPVRKRGRDYDVFLDSLTQVCQSLAQKIVEDGEGATKFITVRVSKSKNENAARQVAFSVAGSSLVKTALFGEDPNWGRIFAAAGYSGVAFNPDRVDIHLNGLTLLKNGAPTSISKSKLQTAMKKKKILIEIELNQGREHAEVYTCDLSYDYIRINAEYTT